MPESIIRAQLNVKLGKDGPMLNLYAETVEELAELEEAARKIPSFAKFFGTTDTQVAAQNVTQAFPGSQAGPEIPRCPQCSGPMEAKTTKTGKNYWACLQVNGTCKNDKGYATSVWPSSGGGRDS